MKKYYKDFYGCTASISKMQSGEYRLRITAGVTKTNKVYATERGARQAMGRYSDGWKEVTK